MAAPALILRTALVVGAVLLVVLAFELLRPREYLTGTNGAGSAGAIVPVGPGQRLCVEGLDVPAETVRLRLGTAPATADVVAKLALGGAERAPATVAAASGRIVVPIPERPREPDSTPASLCLTPSAPLMLAGRPGREGDEAPATVDGAPIDSRVEIAFLPREGARRSLLSQLPEIARRAALFRPDPIAAWTYWLILVAVLPALALAAIATLVRPPRRPALVVGLLAFATAASWALLTPPFNAPDETEHFAYAQTLAERWTVPESDPPGTRRPYSSEQELAWEGAGVAGQIGQRDGRPPWLALEEARWRARVGRERPDRDDGGGPLVGSAYTPTYYAALAPAYHAASGGSIFARLTLMRLVSALLAGITAAAVVGLVRELLPEPRWPAVGAGLLVAFQPMAAFMGGVVNNDAAVNAAAAALLLVVVRALRRGLTPRLAAAVGALVVVALIAKGSGAFLVPAVVLGLVLAARTTRSRDAHAHSAAPARTRGAWSALAAGFVVAALAWAGLATALDRGVSPLTPARVAASNDAFPTTPGPKVDTTKVLDHPGAYLSHLWQLALPPLPFMEDLRPPGIPRPGYTVYVKRAWGAFGFAAILFPGWVYAVIALAMAVVAALAVATLRREREAVRRRVAPAAVLALAGLTVILGAEAIWFEPVPGGELGSFGRYAFPALAPAAALVAGACFGLGRRAAPAIMAGLVTATVVLYLAALWLAVSALYV